MRYRAVSLYGAEKLVAEIFLKGNSPDVDAEDYSSWAGVGEAVDLTELEGIVAGVTGRVPEKKISESKRDLIEGELCSQIHSAIVDLEQSCFEVLDDPGFWSYLGFKHFRELIEWRHSETFDGYKLKPEENLASAVKYFFDPTLKEGVLSRMYMRGHIANESGNYDLASGRAGSGDLWRSHVMRVRTAESPHIAKALARFWIQNKWLTTVSPAGGLRALGKLVNRRRSNIVGIVLDADESDKVIVELAERIRKDGD
jgi:hypothetical protein